MKIGTVMAVMALVLFGCIAFGPMFDGCNSVSGTRSSMHDIQEQVADDQVHQWMVVVEDPHHTMADACVHYDLVIAAYLQAGDDAKYHEWMKNKAKGCDEGTQ